MRFPDYMDQLWKAIKDKGDKSHPLQKMALEADLLILDEVWADNDFEIKELYKIVDGRDGMATIYTTNNKTSDFLDSAKSERLGMSFSRMLDASEIVVLSGRDKRRANIRK